MPLKNYLDKVGILGSVIAGACCLGLPAVLSIFSALGLGFLINDAYLQPLIIVFLALTVVGLAFGYRAHRRIWALAVGVVSAAGAYFFIYGRYLKPLAYLSIAGLVAASALNAVLRRRCAPACES